MPTKTGKLITVDDAAEALCLKPKTVRVWIAARRLGCVRIGGAVRVPLAEVERIISEGSVPAREVL